MTAVLELTKRLRSLPEKEREELAATLLSEMDAQGWDRHVDADAKAGKLDALIKQAKNSHRTGRTTPLQP